MGGKLSFCSSYRAVRTRDGREILDRDARDGDLGTRGDDHQIVALGNDGSGEALDRGGHAVHVFRAFRSQAPDSPMAARGSGLSLAGAVPASLQIASARGSRTRSKT